MIYGRCEGDLIDLETGAVMRPFEVLKAFDRERSLPSILVKNSPQKPQGLKNLTGKDITYLNKQVFLRKKCCSSVWCPTCYKRFYSPNQAQRMALMTWNRVRFVTLTFDRSITGEGEAAYLWYKANKPLGRFIQNLGRAGITVTDWTSNLEWHDDGTPHFHLLIEVDKAGKAGQIGQDKIHDCWPYGRIHEGFFKSEKEFQDFLGYFGKSGYLHKDKQHQIELPSWTQAEKWRGVKINRFSSMRRANADREPTVKIDLEPDREYSETEKRSFIYLEKLENCGGETEIWTIDDEGRQEKLISLKIPYFDLVDATQGFYEPGLGYQLKGSLTQNLGLLNKLCLHSRVRADVAVRGYC